MSGASVAVTGCATYPNQYGYDPYGYNNGYYNNGYYNNGVAQTVTLAQAQEARTRDRFCITLTYAADA